MAADEWDNLAVELKEGDSLISAPDLDHISFGSNSKPIFGNDVGSIAVTHHTSDRDLNLVLPVIASLVYCERYMLDHAATEVSIHLINETPASGAQLANALVVLSSATEDREIQLALGTEPNTNFRPLVLMEVLTRSGHGMFLPALRLNLDLVCTMGQYNSVTLLQIVHAKRLFDSPFWPQLTRLGKITTLQHIAALSKIGLI
uniref:Uncharacterized protein n=1 Tax=Timema shepardi TaxID=629360 RepID=A0A7R9B2N1_TIMSH|nr:unnamed protein product [Timema shepardi]